MNERNIPTVLVVGSINQDEFLLVDSLPAPGETTLVNSLRVAGGGKGANQAVAAARHGGAHIQLIAAVGDDRAGAVQLAELARENVDVRLVQQRKNTITGRAFVLIDRHAHNMILVTTGANASPPVENLREAALPKVVLVQTEIGAFAVEHAARHANTAGARFVLNNGPVIPLPTEVLAQADPLVLNEVEAQQLVGTSTRISAQPALDVLHITHAHSVVVTLGSAGVSYAIGDTEVRVPAPSPPEVVDTTGAGDAFTGTLAAALAAGRSLAQAVPIAQHAAAQTIQGLGARYRSAAMS